ncbi:hypothetical protein [Rahnella laticis]|uniref:hypothetical protein n=1 Tax=Rahnella laticis TaxID=2787622 RepID=UPI0018A28EFE|nr:hypothetical protein [Rahnella laticis]MBF7993702.1 hypothetical protein [Rahnella laticis]
MSKVLLIIVAMLLTYSPVSQAKCTAVKAARNSAVKAGVGVGGPCNVKRAVNQNTDIKDKKGTLKSNR